MIVLSKSLKSIISTLFMHYGPPLTMFIAVCALAGLSYGLTLVYINNNFAFPVNLDDATSVWGVSGKPGVSWLSTPLRKVQLIFGVRRLCC